MGAFWPMALVLAGMIAIGITAALAPPTDPDWTRHSGIAVWTDPKTGCRYAQNRDGMQPLLGPDGRPDCERR